MHARPYTSLISVVVVGGLDQSNPRSPVGRHKNGALPVPRKRRQLF